jgi:hypothetical protein
MSQSVFTNEVQRFVSTAFLNVGMPQREPSPMFVSTVTGLAHHLVRTRVSKTVSHWNVRTVNKDVSVTL